MLISVIDPALIIFENEDWKNRKDHCYRRLEKLSLHLSIIRDEGIILIVSDEFLCHIWDNFPWNLSNGVIPELRDIREVILYAFERARRIKCKSSDRIEFSPDNIVCLHIASEKVIQSWKELVYGILAGEETRNDSPVISTWNPKSSSDEIPASLAVFIVTRDGDSSENYSIPLAWDKESWDIQLAKEEYWPDIDRCVDNHYKKNTSLRLHPMARKERIPFECTKKFTKSLFRYCEKNGDLRNSFIEALAKRVYGILDESLGDEHFGDIGDIRRFRVTNFWRVHYTIHKDKIILEEFGTHDIGGASD